jgi:hypothetical protein
MEQVYTQTGEGVISTLSSGRERLVGEYNLMLGLADGSGKHNIVGHTTGTMAFRGGMQAAQNGCD